MQSAPDVNNSCQHRGARPHYPALSLSSGCQKHQERSEIGKKAAEILIRNIESSTLLPPEHVVLDTEFIVRESSRILNA